MRYLRLVVRILGWKWANTTDNEEKIKISRLQTCYLRVQVFKNVIPVNYEAQFHQHVYAQLLYPSRSQKLKKIVKSSVSFCAFGILVHKKLLKKCWWNRPLITMRRVWCLKEKLCRSDHRYCSLNPSSFSKQNQTFLDNDA